MFAIIETGGKQYLVSPKTKLKIEKIDAPESGEAVFDKVLMRADDKNVEIGNPFINGAKVIGKVLKQGRAKKIRIFKYRSKVRYRRRKGHRQEFTEVEIQDIK